MANILDKNNQHILLQDQGNKNNSFIKNVNELTRNIETILYANTLFSPEVITVLQEIEKLNLSAVVTDLTKGNYLGNRKLDLNLLYNLKDYDESLTQEEQETLWLNISTLPKYDSATVTFKEGSTHTVNFTFDNTPITVATHADLLLQLNNDETFLALLENTLINTFPTVVTGEFIRFYDVVGLASNIERVTLHVASGEAKDTSPTYLWADTTSALQVLATRGTDLVRLGNEIDNIIKLANNISQLMELQSRIPELVDTYTEDTPNGDVTLYNELDKLIAIYNNLMSIVRVFQSIDDVVAVSQNITLVEEVSDNVIPNLPTILNTPNLTLAAQEYANNAATSMNAAADSATLSATKANEIKSVSVENVITGIAGTPAQVLYSSTTGKFTFVIPQGARGERGQAFNPDAHGVFSQRSTYDAMPEGFAFLATNLGEIYFREGAVGSWSAGFPFAKGDKGETGEAGRSILNVLFFSTTSATNNPAQPGATDTYEVNYTEGNPTYFSIYNGLDYALPASTNKVFVSKQGSNSNSGLTLDKPKLTIAAAIIVANTLIVNGATRVTIEIMDAGRYTENIEIPQNVMLYGINATLEGTLAVNNNTYVWLYGHYSAVNNTVMVTKKGNSLAYYRCVIQDARGVIGNLTGCTNISTSITNSTFIVEIELQYVTFKGIVEATSSGNSHIHIRVKSVYLASNNAIAINATGNESDIIGQIDHILMLGTLTGTIGILCDSINGNVDLIANEIIANTVYNIIKGDVRLNCAKNTGTKIGTPVLDLALLLEKTFPATTSTFGVVSLDALSFDNMAKVAPGGYGLGTVARLVVDANSATVTGFYQINNTGANLPLAISGYLVVQASNSNECSQIFITFDNKVFVRNKISATWSNWQTLLTNDIIVTELGTNVDKVINQATITKILLEGVSPKNEYQGPYGIRWDSATDTYIRTGAAGYTSIQSKMRRCVLNPDGTVNYYLHPDNSNFKEDGSLAILTGADGDVMVEIPQVFTKVTQENGVTSFSIAKDTVDGHTLDPAFIKNGVEYPYRYYRAYKGITVNNVLYSRSGVIPTRSRTIVNFRNDARAKGNGWHLTDWYLLNLIRRLCFIEFNDLIVSKYIGNGNYTGGDYGRVTGVSNALGNNSTPPNSDALNYMSYRGIEDFYANDWEFIDGINVRNYGFYINTINNPATYGNDVFTGDYSLVGPTCIAGVSQTWIKQCYESLTGGFIPITSGGGASSYYGDGFWSATGDRIVFFGGSPYYGASDGASCLAVNNASSYSDVNVGAALSR